MADALSIILTIVFVIVIVLLIIGFMGSLGSSTQTSSHRRGITQEQTASSPPPIEGILGLIALGVVGVAAYKFIQSGGLRRLNEEVGKLSVNVNGQRKTIAAAIQDDSYIEQLLQNVIEKKLRDVFESGRPIESLERQTPKAAVDVAHMLQDALEARMRREGLY